MWNVQDNAKDDDVMWLKPALSWNSVWLWEKGVPELVQRVFQGCCLRAFEWMKRYQSWWLPLLMKSMDRGRVGSFFLGSGWDSPFIWFWKANLERTLRGVFKRPLRFLLFQVGYVHGRHLMCCWCVRPCDLYVSVRHLMCTVVYV